MGLGNVSYLNNLYYTLYGMDGGLDLNTPNPFNNYCANLEKFNQACMANPNYAEMLKAYAEKAGTTRNPSFQGSQQQTAAAQATPRFTASQEQSARDAALLANYYSAASNIQENVGSAVISGALSFAAFENPQTVKHPLNSLIALKHTDKIFNDPLIKTFMKENPELAQRAYSQIHANYRNLQPKVSVIQKWFQKPTSKRDFVRDIRPRIKALEKAMKAGNKEEVFRLTKELEAARGMDGYLPSALERIKGFITGKPVEKATPASRIAKKATSTAEAVAEFAKTGGKVPFMKGFMKEFKPFAIFDGVIETVTKVIPTYMKGGTEKGNKQAIQSGVKVAASCAGWAAGRWAGGILGAKAGAAIGTCLGPGIGTAIGGIIGLGVGCLGSWLAEKAVKKFIPVDEAEKLEAAEKSQYKEGRQEMINFVKEKLSKGEYVDPNVVEAANRLQYT